MSIPDTVTDVYTRFTRRRRHVRKHSLVVRAPSLGWPLSWAVPPPPVCLRLLLWHPRTRRWAAPGFWTHRLPSPTPVQPTHNFYFASLQRFCDC